MLDPIAMLPDARAVSPSKTFPNARWNIIDGAVEARPGFGSILTREIFGNYKLHLDFLIPKFTNKLKTRIRTCES